MSVVRDGRLLVRTRANRSFGLRHFHFFVGTAAGERSSETGILSKILTSARVSPPSDSTASLKRKSGISYKLDPRSGNAE